ncbi:MAG: GerMN domain-containing protein [Bryocella sp.]
MIPRHQRIIFWTMVVCIILMGCFLFWGREKQRNRVSDLADQTPIDAPYTNTENVTLDLANDADGTITAATRPMALPDDPSARAKALLEHLIAEYSTQGSPHPLQSGSAIAEVFLLPLPVVGHTIDPNAKTASGATDPSSSLVADPNAIQPHSLGGQLAVVNLRSNFVNAHPSGVEVESLTLLSMIGTLHANLPLIEQVRFLVDGQPRETLAGHADLLRTYPSRDTTTAAQLP